MLAIFRVIMAERVIEFSVPSGIEPERADKIFAAEFDDVSRNRLQKAFDQLPKEVQDFYGEKMAKLGKSLWYAYGYFNV